VADPLREDADRAARLEQSVAVAEDLDVARHAPGTFSAPRTNVRRENARMARAIAPRARR
jgi:hypothetical protein